MSAYQPIAQRQAQVPVRPLCHALHVAPSAYYAWQRRQLPVPEPAWQVAVRTEFKWHSARYGTRRLRAELQAQGHMVGRWRIRRTLAAAGLRAQQPRSFVPRTTDSDPNVRAAPNLPNVGVMTPPSAPRPYAWLARAARPKRPPAR